jgi:hypothetical protein
VKSAHARSDSDPQILRISTDTKAKIKIGEFSRRGKSRGLEPVRALDHDMQETATLIPLGILEVKQKQGNIVYGHSRETSDFIVDGFEHWWSDRKEYYSHITTLQIDLDNGPEIESHRTQFIKRMVDFSDKHQLTIELVYYPPYHSKYNSVEHFWGVLERHWNGTLLTDFNTVQEWTKTMRWAEIAPNVYSLDKNYERGVKLTKKELEPYEKRLKRTKGIEKWSVVIEPKKRE